MTLLCIFGAGFDSVVWTKVCYDPSSHSSSLWYWPGVVGYDTLGNFDAYNFVLNCSFDDEG